MMTKEMIFDEFKIVKEKDLKKKSKDGKESYAHRIAYLQGHADAKKEHPNQYRHLDIKFDNLIKMYQSGDPDMYMYKKCGIEPYWMKKQREEEEERKEKENAKNNTSNNSIN